jgi:hypothetical protein
MLQRCIQAIFRMLHFSNINNVAFYVLLVEYFYSRHGQRVSRLGGGRGRFVDNLVNEGLQSFAIAHPNKSINFFTLFERHNGR